MAMSTVPLLSWRSFSTGMSAVHSADSTTASSSPAVTLYQYHPPSTNGLRDSSKLNSPVVSSPVSADSTCWERPLAVDLYTTTRAPRPASRTVSRTDSTTVQRRQ